jgi:hypothetical protein
VVATSPSPIYGGNNVRQYYGGSPITIDENIKNEDKLGPGTYYVRACKYTASGLDNGCTNYSNQVTLIIGNE